MYYSPGSPSQLAKWHKTACKRPQAMPYYVHTKRNQMTETLDLATLELLAILEGELDVDLDFDADEDLDEAN